MNCLENGADAPYIAVDLSVAEELGGQVRVEACLYIGWRIDPQGWIEEHVVEQLPREKRETEQLRQISQVTYAVLSYGRLNDIAKDWRCGVSVSVCVWERECVQLIVS